MFDFNNLKLPKRVVDYIKEKSALCQPDNIHLCDGSDQDNSELIKLCLDQGIITKLSAYENNYLCITDPADVARVESKTVIATKDKYDTVPHTKEGVKCTLGNWISPEELDKTLQERYNGCMKGRTMYVIPFSMGPIGGSLSKVGVQLSDSPYVAINMKIMTRIGQKVIDILEKDDSNFVKALHSVGLPKPESRPVINNWPCNPEKTIISHIPERYEICSFGSGYGGNSLLGKKCFALRLGSFLGQREGWLAEHMLILGLKTPTGEQRYVAAAFPSACGKTNLAMLEPTLPGYEITCVGDDIAWMKFDKEGRLRAINPENGFFGVAPGTSNKTNPNVMKCLEKNAIFTNVARTNKGEFYWEGLEKNTDFDKVQITDWHNKPWKPNSDTKAAHPNSRFTVPASQCPIIDPKWEDPEGVPIDAIIFGGRRGTGIPLVAEAFDWKHGVFMGASMKSESTAAAEHAANQLMHDPFAMRPFFGYNFGKYLKHWLDMEKNSSFKLPKIYHVNWFLRDESNKFIWPGFGDNSRVLDWICKRLSNKVGCVESAFGNLPKKGELDIKGIDVAFEDLFKLDKKFLLDECDELKDYFETQLGSDMPEEMWKQLDKLKQRSLNL